MRFEAMDQNRDGAISKDEWRGSPRSFQNHDWNRDGQLSGDEVRLGAQRSTTSDQADHIPNRFERNLNWSQAGFNNLDHDRDGRISVSEWHYDRETFRRVDRNRDKPSSERISGQNYDDDGRQLRRIDFTTTGGRAVGMARERGGVQHLDANRDGVLSRFEVVGGRTRPTTRGQFAKPRLQPKALSRDEWHGRRPRSTAETEPRRHPLAA